MRIELGRPRAQAHLPEQVGHAFPLLRCAAQTLDLQRLAQDRAHPHPRIQRRIGILEHQLQVLADLPQARSGQAAEILAFEQHPARGRPLEGDDHPADRGLPAPGLADQAERLAPADRQRHIRDRLHRADRAPHQGAAGDRELLHRVVEHEQVPVGSGLVELAMAVDDLGWRQRRVRAHRVEAGVRVVQVRAAKNRLAGSALFIGEAASRREPASRRRVRQVGRQALDRVEPVRDRLVQPGNRGQQRPGVWMPGATEERTGAGLLDDLAGVHHHHPVGPASDHAHVMGDQQDGHPQALFQVVEQRQDLILDRHVERRGGLVGDEQLRLAGERDADHHALP